MLRNVSNTLVFSAFALLLMLSAIYSITVGPMNITFWDSVTSLTTRSNDLAPHINLVIQDIRLPRTVLCMLIGAIWQYVAQ